MELKNAKKFVFSFILLFSVFLSACYSAPNSSQQSLPTSSNTQGGVTVEEQPPDQYISNTDITLEQPGTTLDTDKDRLPTSLNLAEEPPLNDDDMELAVPDFLTEEQQMLYRRAHSLYEHLIGNSIEYSETLGMEIFPAKEYELVTINDMVYTIAQGRYANWADFEAVGCSIFTKDCWQKLNITSDGLALRTEYNGKLCFLDTSMGGGYYFCRNVPDRFRLEKQADDEIVFTLIGHYRYFDEMTDEDIKQLDAQGYNYTLEFPIKMVLTEAGWRFDEFHSTLRDEREPL